MVTEVRFTTYCGSQDSIGQEKTGEHIPGPRIPVLDSEPYWNITTYTHARYALFKRTGQQMGLWLIHGIVIEQNV